MNTRILLTSVGACVIAAGCTAPLSAASAARPAISASASTTLAAEKAFGLAEVRVAELDGSIATIAVRGASGARVDVHDTETRDSTSGVIGDDNTLSLQVEVPRGSSRTFEVTGRLGGDSSSPIMLPVRNDITSLTAPILAAIDTPARDRMILHLETAPDAVVTVKNADGEVVGQRPFGSPTGVVAVKWNPADLPSQRRFTVTQSYNGVSSPSTPFRHGDFSDIADGALEKPIVDAVTVAGGRVTIAASAPTAPAGAQLRVSDFFGRPVASAPVIAGSASATFPAPSVQSRYLLHVVDASGSAPVASGGLDVTVLEGIGSMVPEAPRVARVQNSGGRIVAKIDGVPGAIASVRDESGRVLAVGRIGARSTTQLVVPVSAVRAGSTYVVTQTTGVIESDPAPLDLADLG